MCCETGENLQSETDASGTQFLMWIHGPSHVMFHIFLAAPVHIYDPLKVPGGTKSLLGCRGFHILDLILIGSQCSRCRFV